MTTHTTDVLIIGGGPAGSTFGNLAARRGWKVTLLEQGRHPRFHIGESLLPMNLPIFEQLGVLDKIERIGVTKLGADFTIVNSGNTHETFYFGKALGESPAYAFEVRRSEFDQILFERCRETGVDARQQVKVIRIDPLPNRRHRVTTEDADGTESAWDAKFVVDASGRDAFMASKNGWKRRDETHASAAIFAHFRNVERRLGEDQGNISIYWFEHGWIWMIPLENATMSIGAVCYPDYMKTRQGSLDAFLLDTLRAQPEISRRIERAEFESKAQATGNYSYRSQRMHGPGYLIIGDAFAFIDPVFSSGVYLAMSSAASGIEAMDAWLNGHTVRFRLACRRHEKKMRRGIKAFSWFIYRFNTPAMRHLLSHPNNRLRIVDAIVSMLAGDVFTNRAVDRRILLFKIIYASAWLTRWRECLATRRRRLDALHQRAGEA